MQAREKVSTRLRVLGLVPYPLDQVGSQRYRIEQWLRWLRDDDVDCRMVPFQSEETYRLLRTSAAGVGASIALARAAADRVRLLRELPDFDVVFIHREAMSFGPAWLERIIARRKPVVFDFDDAIWLPSANPYRRLAPLLKFQGKTRNIVRSAAAVIAGNHYLAEWASRLNPNTQVVPSTLDLETDYAALKQHSAVAVPTIGWSGTTSTLKYLETLRPALTQMAERRKFRLKVIYDGPHLQWPGVDIVTTAWNPVREASEMLDFDIGIMPQPSDEWAKGKCGMKALQYMALGIPPVVSPTGVLPDIVQPGRNGLHADTAVEWVAALQHLLDDANERARLGRAARATVATGYSATIHAPRVAAILRQAARQDGGSHSA